MTCLVSFASPWLSGCGDDVGSGDATAGNDSTGTPATGTNPTGSADDGPSASSSGAGDADATATAGATDDTTTLTPADSSGGSDGTGSGSDDGTGSSSGSDDGSSSSDDGATVPGCEICEDDEVCVVNQALSNEFECHAMPKACDGDVDCDCGAELCVDPFVGCFDPPEPNTLFCACIAC